MKIKNPSVTKPDVFEQDVMRLRDYFAAKAMEGICSIEEVHKNMTEDLMAESCYLIADAMLKARLK